MTEVAGIVALGFAAGVTAGLFGVGGGILVVLALTLVVGLGQLEAQATSLLSVIPVALVGASRQRGYGNLRLRDGLLLGVLACGGSVGGVAIANAVPERVLEVTFAGLVLLVAGQLLRRSRVPPPSDPGSREEAECRASAPPPSQ